MNNQRKEKALKIIESAREIARIGVRPDAVVIFDTIEEIAEEIVSERYDFSFERYSQVIDGSLYLDEVEYLVDLVSCVKDTFVNLTPHTITLVSQHTHEKLEEIPASGIVARAELVQAAISSVGGYPVYHNTYGKVTGLPEPKPNTYYVV